MGLIKKGHFRPEVLESKRKELGLTLEDLGRKIDRHPSVIQGWESKKWEPGPTVLPRLARVLKCEPGDFYAQEND